MTTMPVSSYTRYTVTSLWKSISYGQVWGVFCKLTQCLLPGKCIFWRTLKCFYSVVHNISIAAINWLVWCVFICVCGCFCTYLNRCNSPNLNYWPVKTVIGLQRITLWIWIVIENKMLFFIFCQIKPYFSYCPCLSVFCVMLGYTTTTLLWSWLCNIITFHHTAFTSPYFTCSLHANLLQ